MKADRFEALLWWKLAQRTKEMFHKITQRYTTLEINKNVKFDQFYVIFGRFRDTKSIISTSNKLLYDQIEPLSPISAYREFKNEKIENLMMRKVY